MLFVLTITLLHYSAVTSQASPPPGALTWNSTTGLHPCRRQCLSDEEAHAVCYYLFEIEHYYTLSMACYDCPANTQDCDRPHCVTADGQQRAIVTVNRQMPGPAIEVCQNDIVVVDLVNMLGHESTALHWHGLHQRGHQFMDGVPWLTQCPQTANTVFRYQFPAVQAGTYFWHSHMGFQRSDGAYGALVIRQPASMNPHNSLYDTDLSEHHVLLTDWIKELAVDRFAAHHHSLGTNKPETILINGRGRAPGQHRNQSATPLAEFVVEQGKRHRFRFVSNGIMNCPLALSVDNHNITVIASDGHDLQPVITDSLVIYAGERYDIILEANQPSDVYWLRVQGLMDCGSSFSKAHQVALVRYRGVETSLPADDVTYENCGRVGKQVSPFNVATVSDTTVPVSALRSQSSKQDATSKVHADTTFYVDYDFNQVENPRFHHPQHYSVFTVPKQIRMLTPQFNNITLQMPPFPPLSQPDLPLATCNSSTVHNCSSHMCQCTHVLNVPLGNVVELIIIDRGFRYNANHPVHLHGYSFRVVAMERVGMSVTRDEVVRRNEAGLIGRNLLSAPLKDTVTVPDGGFTVVRFHADNPGWWLFHCHMNFHSEIGMALIFHVGEPHHVPPVPAGFPRCGHFRPEANHFRSPDGESGKSALASSLAAPIHSAATSVCPYPQILQILAISSLVLLAAGARPH